MQHNGDWCMYVIGSHIWFGIALTLAREEAAHLLLLRIWSTVSVCRACCALHVRVDSRRFVVCLQFDVRGVKLPVSARQFCMLVCYVSSRASTVVAAQQRRHSIYYYYYYSKLLLPHIFNFPREMRTSIDHSNRCWRESTHLSSSWISRSICDCGCAPSKTLSGWDAVPNRFHLGMRCNTTSIDGIQRAIAFVTFVQRYQNNHSVWRECKQISHMSRAPTLTLLDKHVYVGYACATCIPIRLIIPSSLLRYVQTWYSL